MDNESSDIRIAENTLECDIVQDTSDPASLMDDDINEASNPGIESDENKKQKKRRPECEPVTPYHVHEVQGFVDTAQKGAKAHDHRLLVVSSESKPIGEFNHVHEVIFSTDYHGEFCHEGWSTTSGAFPVGDGHVHFLEGITTTDDGHWHKYRIATSLDMG